MVQSAPPPAPTRRRLRARRIALRTGWLLLAAASFCATYALLVAGGR